MTSSANAVHHAGSEIRFEAVSRKFGTQLALERVNLTIAPREFVAIVGPSGCGKTTLLRMVAGLDFPTTGRILVGGEKVHGPGPDRSVVFQQFALFPWKTVAENIAFGLLCRGEHGSPLRQKVQRYIELMHLQGHEDAYPHQLSGGMQQRVAIARSYAVEPHVLLMDEPFGALDAQTRTVMQEELVRICAANPRTVVFITHAVEEAVYLADRVVVMSRHPGCIREIVDVGPVRAAENWRGKRRVEDVLELPAFIQLRGRIWRLLRDEDDEAEGVSPVVTAHAAPVD